MGKAIPSNRHTRTTARQPVPAVLHPKIALVASSLDILGGQSIQAESLMHALRDEGYAVEFIPIDPKFPRGMGFLRRYPYLRTVVNQAIYLPMLLRISGADVVHIFSAAYWSFLIAPVPAMLAGRVFRKRVILNYHSGHAEKHLKKWGKLVHPWLRLADVVVVPSEYLQRVFNSYGHQARVIRNAVDISAFRFRERAPLRPRLLSTRNLQLIYRVDNTIKAFALLRSRYPEATLTVAGYGSEEARIRRLAAAVTTGGVHFLGRVEPSAMPSIYERADIVLNSSVVDNQPLSVLEAFASGLPVVSTPTGAIRELVRPGETGMIVPVDDPRAMAEGVTTLLKNQDFALQLARRARAEVAKFTWLEVKRDWSAVYMGRAAGEKNPVDGPIFRGGPQNRIGESDREWATGKRR